MDAHVIQPFARVVDRRPLLVLAWLLANLFAPSAYASMQTEMCRNPPAPPQEVRADVEDALKATANAPFSPAVLTLHWKAPDVDRARPGDAPLAYAVEAGSAPGMSDIAVVHTADLSFTTPMANGIYYLRARALNACGTGRASRESRVRIENSVAKGQPNPLVILSSANATRERLGDRAYVRVAGQVRNGWHAAPAAFVTVTGTFEGSTGELGVTATTYASGTSRRLKRSGVVTDTAIEPGATGCFLLFAEFRGSNVTGLGLVASAEAFDTDPLPGGVAVEGSPAQAPDEFGSLVVSGRVTNSGPQPTFANLVWVETISAAGQVLDCHAASVRGMTITEEGLSTRSWLAPAANGVFRNATEAVAAQVRSFRHWTTWDQWETRASPTLTAEYRALRQRLIGLIEGEEDATSPQEIAAAREALREESRSIERRLDTRP
jgi:hypothetical protein